MLTAVAVGWTALPATYPFGPADPSAILSTLGGVPPSVAAPLAVGVGLAGVLLAIALLRGAGPASTPRPLVAGAWVLAALLLLVVPDYRALVIVAYTPLFIVGLPFGFIAPADYVSVFTPQIIGQAFAIAGGITWAAVALERTTLLPSYAEADRWGRVATWVAVAIPLVYAATRWVWAIGIPLGLSDEMFRLGQETGLWTVGAGLATLAVAGAFLTLGLVMPWGERWPSRLPWLGGRPVPVALAVVPAVIVAALVTAAGLMFVRLIAFGTLDDALAPLRGIEGSWTALGPELLWPVWGPALALAAYAYARRRSIDASEPRPGSEGSRS